MRGILAASALAAAMCGATGAGADLIYSFSGTFSDPYSIGDTSTFSTLYGLTPTVDGTITFSALGFSSSGIQTFINPNAQFQVNGLTQEGVASVEISPDFTELVISINNSLQPQASELLDFLFEETPGSGESITTFDRSAFQIYQDDPVAVYEYVTFDGSVTSNGTPPGIDTSVPEPTTWAMIITGFGLIGAASRRRPYGLA